MKKLLVYLVVASLLLGVNFGSALAQEEISLPGAGLTPESFFYFLDRFGETIQEFFTFSAEGKAKLQIKFAGERIAEIKIMVVNKGTKTKGVDKAKTLLLANVARAAEILKEEKTSGKDVAQLAKELDDKFDAQEKLLIKSFQDARKKLKQDRLALKRSLAEQTGDAALIALLEQQINDLELRDDELKDKKDEIKESLRDKKEKIEDELEDEDREEDKHEEIEDDKYEEEENREIEDENENEYENEDENENEEVNNEDTSGEDSNGIDNRASTSTASST